MNILHTVAEMRNHADGERANGRRLGLVPTMGALHAGHLALVRAAKEAADHVTVSIFVNPTQFGPDEDYEDYPRTLEADLQTLEETGGVEAVFAPPVSEMYPDGLEAERTWIVTEDLDRFLCGGHRPGHFRGVTTVVSKLFHVCRPDAAFFGQKDAQQLVILRRMARDLCFGVEVNGVPIVREEDGLAYSSRNAYLSRPERAQAVVLSEAVRAARRQVEEGEQRGEAVVQAMRQKLAGAPDAQVQYAELVDAEHLVPVRQIAAGQEVLAAVAVYFGKTRLIDNAFARAPAGASTNRS